MVSAELTRAEAREIGVPSTAQMVERLRRSAGAIIEARRAALDEGIGNKSRLRYASCGPRSHLNSNASTRPRGSQVMSVAAVFRHTALRKSAIDDSDF